MSDNNVRLQNLRDFTVQIRNTQDQIVGTGIAVSTDGKIATCAHVVRAAGIEPRNADGKEVGVYFPQARGGEDKKRKGTVIAFFKEHDDDIVLLQLDSPSPLTSEQIAVLGMADKSEGHPFRTYGYSPIGDYPAARGDGVILGSVEPPTDRILKVDPIQLKSRDIAAGMSGAAVLDATRNLIIGLVTERFYSPGLIQDDIGYGVDSKVLTFNPFNFELRGEMLELKPAPEFRLDKDLFKQAIEIANYAIAHRTSTEKYFWNNAPAVLKEWTGRDELLGQITSDWNSHQKHVTGLIGFGGEGKSSLARKWVDNLLNDSSQPQPDGVFWWGFYENRSVDEFIEAALNYMSGEKIDPQQVQSSNLRAQIIGAMLGAGRYLFVLDGLEVMQHLDGDQYGLLASNGLRDLLTFFARPDNQSFCLITSRAPLFDLMDYTTYAHRDVDRLSKEDGRTLLRRLNVIGSDAELDEVVSEWDGHALTLSIIAAYLAEHYSGDVKRLADIPVPEANEPRYERVHRVLRHYDEHLTETERDFLKLFSVFRTPVHEDAFKRVFQAKRGFWKKIFGRKGEPISKALASLDDESFNAIISHLLHYRILRIDLQEYSYTIHPLIRNHYFALLTKGDPGNEKVAHEHIKEYYLSIVGDIPQYPTLNDLKPLVEVVYHACHVGAYDDAFNIMYQRIYRGYPDRLLVNHLGAWETALELMLEFFPNGDTSRIPQVSNFEHKGWILNEFGLCLSDRGSLEEALSFHERAAKFYVVIKDWRDAGICYDNIARLYENLGALKPSLESSHEGLTFIRRALAIAHSRENCWAERSSMADQAWFYHLCGESRLASTVFEQAEMLERGFEWGQHYLYGSDGIRYADHLRRVGNNDYARHITQANLEISEQNHLIGNISMCHRVLGDLDSDSGDHVSARTHYESALKIALGISVRDVLIAALLARGRWQAKLVKDADAAFSDLNEALGYCFEGGYRIYEADVRVALAWAYLANNEKQKVKESAELALQMSNEMGYYWGKMDAEEVLKEIGK